MQPLTREIILRALARLDEKLGEQGVKGEVCLVGGSVMMLAFNARQATKDVDAIFQPTAAIRTAIKEIQSEQGLPNDWMNDAAKGYLSSKHQASVEEAKNLPRFAHLTVSWPHPDYLLAMKAMSSRVDVVGDQQRDVEDMKILVQHLQLKTPSQVFDIVEKYYPADHVPPRTQYVVNMVFRQLAGSAKGT